MFDLAKIKIKAGDGGNGAVSFRREKYIPKGGPDGGHGGQGGNIIFESDQQLNTLKHISNKREFKAEDGETGGRNQRIGKSGKNLVLPVPPGTVVWEIKDNEKLLLADLTPNEPHQPTSVIAARGGKGGKGNSAFKSSTNQTPKKAQKGTKGEEKNILLEVKLIADVGLVGMPSAGKTTLINKLTGTKAKTADYPFTTLSPNIGVTRFKGNKEVVIADIPGLIEGASAGKGLGDEFLRHIERTKIIVHLLDAGKILTEGQTALEKDYKIIRQELNNYSPLLTEKQEIVAVNKSDLLNEKIENKKVKIGDKIKPLFISALTGDGLDLLKEHIVKVLESATPSTIEAKTASPQFTIDTLPNRRVVFY